MTTKLHQAMEAVLKTHPGSVDECMRQLERRTAAEDIYDVLIGDAEAVYLYFTRAFDGELQDCYLVTRGGREVSVPRDEMTILERKQTAARLRKEGAELQQHADELRSYSNLVRQIDDLDEPTPIR